MDRNSSGIARASLRLPRDLKNRILADQRLTLHQKFVLFTLYYLDSKGRLEEYQSYVPQFLNLAEKDFRDDLNELARHNYLRMDRNTLSLAVRPLRYQGS